MIEEGTMTQAGFEIDAPLVPPAIDLRPEKIEFGRTFVPIWLSCAYKNGGWQQPRIGRLDSIQLHPAAIVFHYGQAIFEGMKAFKYADGSVNLFRPLENARRFNRSAERMAMPAVDEDIFVEGIRLLVDRQREWVPEFPGSLYIRPTMIATEPCIGVRTAPEFLYYVITLPSGAYFPQMAGGAGSIRVFVTSTVGRAAPGGTGNVKAAVNYAVTLKVISEGKKKGCAQVLFLDSCGHGRIEEMGGMNVFFVQGRKLITPRVTGTILRGITRDSIVAMAPSLGYSVEEREIPLDTLLEQLKAGTVTEAFATGTAAVVAGIGSFLLESGEEITIGSGGCGEVTAELNHRLTDIQYGKASDPFGWITRV
jgi:branched-chain amino acid aminotransferase